MYLLFYLLGITVPTDCHVQLAHCDSFRYKSLLGLYTGRDSLGEKSGRIS